MLVVPIHPLRLSAFVLADSALPRGLAYRVTGGYVVPEASHRAVTSSACPSRERLMEQPVSSGHADPVKQRNMRLAGRTSESRSYLSLSSLRLPRQPFSINPSVKRVNVLPAFVVQNGLTLTCFLS